MRYLSTILSMLILLSSCEEVTTLEPTPEPSGLIVVEGLITNEFRRHYVRITRPNTEPNQPPLEVSGAEVLVSFGNNRIRFIEEPSGSGNYLSEVEFRGVSNTAYLLAIQVEGRQYFGATRKVPVQPLRPIQQAVQPLDNGNYVMREVRERGASMTRVFLDWSSTDSCTNQAPCNAIQTFYTLNSIDVNQYFAPDKQVIEFPSGTVIVRRKLSLTVAHQDFVRALLNETIWRGGAFDVQQGNLPTNLSEGAIGFFAAASVVSDTTIVP